MRGREGGKVVRGEKWQRGRGKETGGGTSEQKCKGWIFLPVILVF